LARISFYLDEHIQLALAVLRRLMKLYFGKIKGWARKETIIIESKQKQEGSHEKNNLCCFNLFDFVFGQPCLCTVWKDFGTEILL